MIIDRARIYTILFSTILFLNLFGALINETLKVEGIPISISPIKSLALIILIFLLSLKKKHLTAILILMIFSILYFITGILQDRFLPTIYFIRIYVEPLIFLCCMSALVQNNDIYQRLLNIIINFSLIFALTGIISFFILNYTGHLKIFINDNTFITDNWHITYTNIIRNGLAIGDPNKTGFVQIAFLGLIFLKYSEIKDFIGKFKLSFLILILGIGLILTFSKSSIGAFLIFFMIYHVNKFELKKIFGLIIVMISLTTIISFSMPSEERNSIDKWFNSIIKLEDSSSIGHIDSFNKGTQILKESWLLGSVKGVYGQKAMGFSGFKWVIESSVLILAIDLGIFGLILYISYVLIFLLDFGKISKSLIFYIILIFPPLLVLPMIQELEAMLIVFTLIPFIKFNSSQNKRNDNHEANHNYNSDL